jgi:hypothetical protein
MELAQNILVYTAFIGAIGFLVLKFFFPKVLKSKKSDSKTGCGTDCGC